MRLRAVGPRKLLALRPFLDDLVVQVETPSYIADDPVAFMHAYGEKADMEIAGFFAALMAWGRRDIVLKKVEDLLNRMGNAPAAFVAEYSDAHRARLDGFVHRTWNADDVDALCRILRRAVSQYGSFEGFWADCYAEAQLRGLNLMEVFHSKFFALEPDTPARTRRHVGDALKGSSCKRLWLYLRWCLRRGSPVDLGIMGFMPVSELMLPLDVHVARYARMLGLLTRPSNDWKAVVELTERLRRLDPADPSKYDFALFGLGVMGGIQVPEAFVVNPLSAL